MAKRKSTSLEQAKPRPAQKPRPDSDAISRPALGSMAGLLVLAGQLALFVYPGNWGWGFGLTLLGLACFMWARVGPPFRWGMRLVGNVPLTVPRLLIFVAVLLSLTATWFAAALERNGRSDFAPALALWAAAGISLLGAFAPTTIELPDLRRWFVEHRRELLIVAGVSLLGGVARFYKLGIIPHVVEGDGGRIGEVALTTSRHPMANPFSMFESIGGLYLQGIALAMRAFGHSLFSLRLLPAISGSLAVPALYLFSRRLFGPRVALIAAIILAFSHSHMHFSRTVAVTYTQGTFLVPLMLYFFFTGLQNKSSLRMVAAAIILALHFSIYVDSLIFILYTLVYTLVAWLVARPLIEGRRPQIIAFVLSAALLMLPQAQYAFAFPEHFMERFNQDGVFQTGWLQDRVSVSGRNPAVILAGRVVHAFLSLFYYPAHDFYGTPIPMLHFVSAGLFLLGLIYSVWRTREPGHLLVNGYLFAPAVAIGLTAVPASADSYRMLIALPAAIVLAGVGLNELLYVLFNSKIGGGRARFALSGILLVTVSVLNLKTYFIDFPVKCRYGGDPQTRFASYLGDYMGTLDRAASVYVLSDDIYQYGTHGSVDFLSGGLEAVNVPNPADDLEPGPNMVVIAAPTRVEELNHWAEDYPGGEIELEYDCGELILMGYQLP